MVHTLPKTRLRWTGLFVVGMALPGMLLMLLGHIGLLATDFVAACSACFAHEVSLFQGWCLSE